MTIQKLVVGLGGVHEPDAVFPEVAALSKRTGLPLDVVHAFNVSDPFVDTYLRTSTLPGDPLRHYGEGLQARLEGQVGGLAGHSEVHCRAVAGDAPTVLHEAARDGDCLLVVGPTRRGRMGAALLGTTAQRVLHGARTPVLVLRGELPARPRVLFCVDLGSPGALRIVQEGITVIRALCASGTFEASVLVVIGLELDLPIVDLNDHLAATARERLDAFVAELPEGVEVESRIRTGSPAREAVAEAVEWRADLLVVGSHGRTGAARAILGSVAEAVVRDAPRSVLVIPPG